MARYEEVRQEKTWTPKTTLGKRVLAGEITNMEQIYEKNLAILEPEIIDKLVPNLQEVVLNIRTVQRTTDSGRKGSFSIAVVVGNKDGFVGVGTGKGLEVRPTIERAMRNAKKNIIHIRRGCGSWDCRCDNPHSIPFAVRGRYSSVKIELKPAPKGTGIIAGKSAKKVLELAGVKDVWSRAVGKTSTTLNFAMATLEALHQTRKTKLRKDVEIV
jgi:small subunit ribosomal protein S5